ncbi:MAG: zinc/manganese transport system substrate-binding protein [Solirubrobacteraceae bacterium]|nr:zinc/manganese transport system substrate-binding protein [Solirubrobacteraceae bacterium]
MHRLQAAANPTPALIAKSERKRESFSASVLMMRRRWFIAMLAVTLAAATLAACGSGDGGAGGHPAIVATTTQVGDFAREVAGDRARVRQILSSNSDPHAYEPRPSDIRAVTSARVVLRSGGDLDEWLGDVLRNAGSKAKTVTLIDAVRTRKGEGGVDPHWWQDPRNAAIAVAKIRDALIAADAGGRAAYNANAARYLAKLRAQDHAIAACIRQVPKPQRKLVTDHDALGYFADRYGIQVIGTVIPALSSQAQSSAGDVARLVRTIRQSGVSTIFSESSANPKLAEAIARDAGASVGQPLYADSLGPEGSDGATYLGSLRANTRALVAGFTNGRTRCDQL